jgi:HEAT repeat protein
MRLTIYKRGVSKAVALVLAATTCSCWTFAVAPQAPPSPAAQNPAAAAQPSPEQPTTAPPAVPSTVLLPSKPQHITREAIRRDAWKCLNEGLAEKSSERRAEAIVALSTVGIRSDVVRLVESGLADKSLEVRQIAAAALGDMKSRSSIPKLREALDDESAAVSFTAAKALWGMGDQSGLSIFVQVLVADRKTSPGLIHTKWHDMQKELHDPRALAELGAVQTAGLFLGPAGFGVSLIEELAKDKTSAARALSAQMLGHNMGPAAREALEEALGDKSWVVRASTAEAIGRQGSARAIEKLVPLLDDSRSEVRYSGAAAIIRLSPRRGYDAVKLAKPTPPSLANPPGR